MAVCTGGVLVLVVPSVELDVGLLSVVFRGVPPAIINVDVGVPARGGGSDAGSVPVVTSLTLSLGVFFVGLSGTSSSPSSVGGSSRGFGLFVPSVVISGGVGSPLGGNVLFVFISFVRLLVLFFFGAVFPLLFLATVTLLSLSYVVAPSVAT